MTDKAKSSLVVAVLRNIALRVGLVIFIASAFTYIHLTEAARKDFFEKLTLYASEHAAHEAEIFSLAKDNMETAEELFRDRLAFLDKTNPEPTFTQKFVRWSDGTVRDAPANHELSAFPYDKKAGTFLGNKAKLTDDLKRRVLAGQFVADMVGPSWNNRFTNFYVLTPENTVTNFWPTLPWTHQATKELDIRNEEYFYVSDKKHNKARETAWTGLYYDAVAKDWMISCLRPIDAADGRHLASVGVDILVNELIDQTTSKFFTGTYNFLVDPDGRLIAHPLKMKEIEKKLGKFFVEQSGDPELVDIFNTIKGKPDGIYSISSQDLYAASYKLGPLGWHFVTVLPQQVIRNVVYENTSIVFFTGIISLIAELIVLGFIIRGYIISPLKNLTGSISSLQKGEHPSMIETKNAKGEVATLIGGYNSMMKTIGEREEDLRKALKLADSANKAKTNFLANMSHELRTPLNSIIGMSQMLREKKLPEDDRKMIEVVYEAAGALLETVNDILDISKIESGEMHLEQIPFKPYSAIERVEMIMKPLASAKGLLLTLTNDKIFEDLIVLGDSIRFSRVVTNLVSNASKYTEKGSVNVFAEYKETAPEKGEVTIRVVDTGIGISKEKTKRIFEKFVQADTSITRRFGGTGLGLSIARELVEMMGGSIGLKSEVGVGSEFHFTIPVTVVASEEYVQPFHISRRSDVSSDMPSVPVSQARVLVAEDHKLNILLLRQILKNLGIADVDVVTTGNAAIESRKNKSYDLVLMDCHMPETDGIEACTVIRAYEVEQGLKPVPIIALSADVLMENIDQCFAAGMDEFLGKPLNIEKMKKTLVRWIDFKFEATSS